MREPRINVIEAHLYNEKDVTDFWHIMEPKMAHAVTRYSDPMVVDWSIRFHLRALTAMVAAGFFHVRYIMVDDAIVPVARSAGLEEHWWFIGSLLNCSFEPPCTPRQLPYALAHIPALADPYIHPRMLSSCQTVPSDEGCEFDVPATLEHYVQAAPKKYRSEWGRLMRKAEAAGITWSNPSARLALAEADKLIDQYAAHWQGRNDSYSDESQMMRHTLEAFREANPTQWISLVIADRMGQTLAVNFAWIKRGVIYDTMCIREVSDYTRPFSVGVLAILYNIQTAILYKAARYSLAAGDQSYKKQFSYGVPTPAANLICLSDIDVVQNSYPGYYNGRWVTEENPVQLTPAQIGYIHEQYPFTLESQETTE